mgnify:CR=1 FL=1
MSLSRAKSRKRQRMYIIGAVLLAVAGAAALALTAFEEGTVTKLQDGKTIAFVVTDMAQSVTVAYSGILPDLFREGQGIVAEGHMNANGTFVASEVLAKHDENYMPPEVAESLKKSGYWEEIEAKNAKQMRN